MLQELDQDCEDKYDCFIKEHCNFILQREYNGDNHLMTFTIAAKTVSMLFALFTALFIFKDKRLKAHPGMLIALIFMFQGGYLLMK